MAKYTVTLARVEYLSQVVEVEADSLDDAQDLAWDQSGKWSRVDSEEFLNNIEEKAA